MRHTMAYREVDAEGNARDPPRLQAGDRHPLPADGAQVLMAETIDHPVDHAPESGSGPQRRIVTLRIRRYNPEAGDTEPSWHDYPVEVLPTDRILDALGQDQVASRTALSPTVVRVPMASAGPTPCGSTAATGSRARP